MLFRSEEIDLVGGLDTDGFNGHVILSLDANPASRAWFDLIHSSRDRNDGTQTFTIEAEVTLTLPDGNRERTVLDDCYLSADVLNLPASKDRTTQGWTLTSATMSRLTS